MQRALNLSLVPCSRLTHQLPLGISVGCLPGTLKFPRAKLQGSLPARPPHLCSSRPECLHFPPPYSWSICLVRHGVPHLTTFISADLIISPLEFGRSLLTGLLPSYLISAHFLLEASRLLSLKTSCPFGVMEVYWN